MYGTKVEFEKYTLVAVLERRVIILYIVEGAIEKRIFRIMRTKVSPVANRGGARKVANGISANIGYVDAKIEKLSTNSV